MTHRENALPVARFRIPAKIRSIAGHRNRTHPVFPKMAGQRETNPIYFRVDEVGGARVWNGIWTHDDISRHAFQKDDDGCRFRIRIPGMKPFGGIAKTVDISYAALFSTQLSGDLFNSRGIYVYHYITIMSHHSSCRIALPATMA